MWNVSANALANEETVRGLATYEKTPRSLHFFRSSGEFEEVITITGRCRIRSSDLISRRSCSPLIVGNFKSKNTAAKVELSNRTSLR